MRLIRFGEKGNELPGLLDVNGERFDVSGFGEEYDERFFESGGLSRLSQWFSVNKKTCPKVLGTMRLGSPIARPSKIICIGLNYATHAKESGMDLPKEPIIFFKSTSAICGPNDQLIIPKNSTKTDWEVELAVVIGSRASYLNPLNAMKYVAGYMVHNDYSERSFQLEHSGQWVKGKSADTFAPFGPFMATKDEIADPHKLKLWLEVNGKKMQESSTSDLIFNIPFIIAYLSQYMTLLPGDVISTGTPEGVGMGMKPPRYLQAGDTVHLGIEGLGSQSQKVVAYG